MKHNYLVIIFMIGQLYAAPNVSKYRIYCNTESQNIYQWGEVPPTTCPNNTAHEVNLNSISIVDEQGPALFSIKEETTPTGGHYRTETETINANAGPNVTTTLQYSWPFDISVLTIYLLPNASNGGDNLSITVAADTVYGILGQDITAGITIIPVSQSVIDNIAKGYYVKLDDGMNADALGRVISIDAINNTITVEMAAAHSFSALTPTQVQVSIRPVDSIELVSNLQYTIGMKKIGASFIPANTLVTVDYVNKTVVPKKLVLTYEYLY